MIATVQERETYKRQNVLKLATWEIAEVNAGRRDKEVRAWLDKPKPMLFMDAKEIIIAEANDVDLQAAWHSYASTISYHHADDSGQEWALAVPLRDRLKDIEAEIKRRALPRPTGNYLISSYDRIDWDAS